MSLSENPYPDSFFPQFSPIKSSEKNSAEIIEKSTDFNNSPHTKNTEFTNKKIKVLDNSKTIKKKQLKCPKCYSIVSKHNINFEVLLFMCENSQCDFPFEEKNLEDFFMKKDKKIKGIANLRKKLKAKYKENEEFFKEMFCNVK